MLLLCYHMYILHRHVNMTASHSLQPRDSDGIPIAVEGAMDADWNLRQGCIDDDAAKRTF